MPRIIPEEKTSGSGGGGNTEGSGTQTTFVYRQGGVAAGNVYNDWTDLNLDLAQVQGPKIVQIDDSVTSPTTIPPGFYNFSDVTLVGSSDVRGAPPVVEFQNGAAFIALEKIQNLDVRTSSLSPIFNIGTAKQVIVEDSILSANPGASTLFSSNSTFDLVLDRTTVTGVSPVVDVTGGTTTVFLQNQTSVLPGAFTSSPASIVDFKCVDPNVSLGTQVGISGATSTVNLSEADKIAYNNLTSGLVAEDVQAAIDEIVATGVGTGNVIGPGPTVTDLGIVTWDGTGGVTIRDSGIRHYGKSATNPVSPAPAQGDIYYNTSINMMMEYDSTRSKWLSVETTSFQFGRNNNVPAGTYYRGIDGRVFSSSVGFPAYFDGTVVSIGYTRTDSDAATFEVTADGAAVASLASAATTGIDTTTNSDFSSGDILAVRNAAGGSTTSNVQGWVRIKWRI